MADLVVRVAGEAGEGPTTIGDFIARTAARSGYHIYTFHTFPAEIKGGHVYLQTRIGEQTVLSYGGDSPDVLLALNNDAYDRWGNLVRADGLILYDSNRCSLPEDVHANAVGIPGDELAAKEVGSKIAQNVVMFGAFAELVQLDREVCEQLIRDRWGHKGQKIIDLNLKALDVGMRYVRQQGVRVPDRLHLPRRPDAGERLILTGYQAVSMGAVAAGLNYFAGYPITPATPIMEWLSSHLPAFGGTVMQMEDEIAAMASVLGASFTGAKAMTATSGPGLSLMVELIGLGVMTELPAVIVDVQRGGPSTGLPTKTEQGDFNTALYGGHGGAPRVVMAACSVEDCFYTTIQAFNLAERLQVPVIVLSDQVLNYRVSTIPRPNLEGLKIERRTVYKPNGTYKRFEITPDGVAPMALPGMPDAMFVATGLEHDEYGRPSWEPAVHEAMMSKRSRKLELALAEQDEMVRWWGDPKGSIGILGWGSSEGVIRQAVQTAVEQGYPVVAMHPRLLHPLPDKHVRRLMRQCRKILVPENNHSGQFGHYLRAHYFGQWDGEFVPWTKCDGMPFSAKEILDGIRDIAG